MMAYLLNVFDLLGTLIALGFGAHELNPFMQNVPFMVFYKTVIVGGLLWWLAGREERVARVGLQLCSVVYGAICLHHLVGIAMLI